MKTKINAKDKNSKDDGTRNNIIEKKKRSGKG